MIGAVNNSMSAVQKQQAYGTFSSVSEKTQNNISENIQNNVFEKAQNNISLADLAFKASCTAAVASGAATMLLGIHGNTAAATSALASTVVSAAAICTLAIVDGRKDAQTNQTADSNSTHYDILMQDINNIV